MKKLNLQIFLLSRIDIKARKTVEDGFFESKNF